MSSQTWLAGDPGSRAFPLAGLALPVPEAATLTALDVWVDSHDVVHQMNIQLLGGDGQTTLTVTFTDFGQPQSITAPATSNPVPASP